MGGERLDTRNVASKLMLTIPWRMGTRDHAERQREGIVGEGRGQMQRLPISIDAAQIMAAAS